MKVSEITSSFVNTLKTGFASLRSTFGESKGVQILSGVLVLQLAVAVTLWWRSSSQADYAPVAHLVSADLSVVNEIVVDDGGSSVTLAKIDEQWRMNDEHKTLASADRINQLLSDIAELIPGLPVASTSGSHQQLEVSETDYQRRVTLNSSDGAIADFYMGTSPGFRKSHLRRVDQDQVYAARLSTFDVPASQEDWLDNDLLAFESVEGVRTDSVSLELADEQWVLVKPEGRLETHEVDQVGMGSLVSQLNSLRVSGFSTALENEASNASLDSNEPEVSEQRDQTEGAEADKLVTHSITVVQNDTPVVVLLSRSGNNATIERSDISGLFSLPVAVYENMTAETIDQLVIEKSNDVPEESEQPQG